LERISAGFRIKDPQDRRINGELLAKMFFYGNLAHTAATIPAAAAAAATTTTTTTAITVTVGFLFMDEVDHWEAVPFELGGFVRFSSFFLLLRSLWVQYLMIDMRWKDEQI